VGDPVGEIAHLHSMAQYEWLCPTSPFPANDLKAWM
jgi:hypothetical protein